MIAFVGSPKLTFLFSIYSEVTARAFEDGIGCAHHKGGQVEGHLVTLMAVAWVRREKK
jgi:hypothetical protein